MSCSKSSLRADLAAGKTRQVIENLIACAAADPDLHTEAIALSARYQNYLREKHGGRAEPAWLDAELNQIHAAALDLVERLPEGGVPGIFNWKKWAAIIGSVVAFGAGVAEFSGYSLRDFFKNPEPEPVVQPASEPEKPAEKPAELPKTQRKEAQKTKPTSLCKTRPKSATSSRAIPMSSTSNKIFEA